MPSSIMRSVLSRLAPALCGFALALSADRAAAYDTTCHLNYPIVMSHHWSMTRLCGKAGEATNTAGCVVTDPAELALPPRTRSPYDPALKRDEAVYYHRYYSKAIIDKLATDCGNRVFLSDKPAFASYAERARSLRNTVLQALAETHADKVVIIGMSQGVQDARYLIAELPVSDTNPALGAMRDKVAGLASVVGEDGGAESGSLLLDAMYLLNGGNWANTAVLGADLFDAAAFAETSWKRATPAGDVAVLREGCNGSCDLGTLEAKWKTTLHSIVNLSTKYMKPNLAQTYSFVNAWSALLAYVGAPDASFLVRVTPAEEANNGVRYLNYQGAIRTPYAGWNLQTLTTWSLIDAAVGPNDSHVSVQNQRFTNGAANFANVKLMAGSPLGRGYHHMWFSGRDDALYGPGAGYREPAPYNGSSAEFYGQLTRDLKSRGL
jgi:hypothetical protein